MLEIPTARLVEQVQLAHELFPQAESVAPVWKPASRTLDVGALVWNRDPRTGERRGKVMSLSRRPEGAVIL